MKRTINEIYNLIINQRENAKNQLLMLRKVNEFFKTSNDKTLFETLREHALMDKLRGEIDVYTNVICLIESSEVLK